MKIAITADIHLRTKGDCPERYNVLLSILECAEVENIGTLVIAGDLFDKDYRNYSEFENLCKEHPLIHLHIIPGNHDIGISDKNIIGENIHVYAVPTVVEISSIPFLFLPYEEKTRMVEKIAIVEEKITGKEWILVAHGDYYGGVKELNPLEPGTYMPLSRNNVDTLKPKVVFLGHIHQCFNSGNVYYAGSPCGLDISETGKRRFLEYDTSSGSVVSHPITTDVIYFKETFVIVPDDNETSLLRQEISKRIKSWTIDKTDYTKVRLRVEAIGYSRDRSSILSTIKEGFDGFSYYKDQGPIIERLSVSTDRQLNAVAERTMKLIDNLQWNFVGDEPERDRLKIEALNLIYQT